MTFSIVARCAETGMFGVAVASSSPAVAARCAYARAKVGAIASQNITDPTLGPRGLDLMAQGAAATEALETLCRTGAHIRYRQILMVDGRGATAVYSGPQALGIYGDASGDQVACGGNLLSSPEIPGIMVAAFTKASGHLGDRLLAAMQAALAAGGEAGPIHSAGIKLVDEVSWPVADLRVDWTEGDPVGELADLWRRYTPQLDDYVTRALDPTAAPSYGVAGDE